MNTTSKAWYDCADMKIRYKECKCVCAARLVILLKWRTRKSLRSDVADLGRNLYGASSLSFLTFFWYLFSRGRSASLKLIVVLRYFSCRHVLHSFSESKKKKKDGIRSESVAFPPNSPLLTGVAKRLIMYWINEGKRPPPPLFFDFLAKSFIYKDKYILCKIGTAHMNICKCT